MVTCQSQSWFKEIPEEEERILAMFMAENAEPQRTLADLIMQKIQEKDSSGKEIGCSWDLRESSLSLVHVNLNDVIATCKWLALSGKLYHEASMIIPVI